MHQASPKYQLNRDHFPTSRSLRKRGQSIPRIVVGTQHSLALMLALSHRLHMTSERGMCRSLCDLPPHFSVSKSLEIGQKLGLGSCWGAGLMQAVSTSVPQLSPVSSSPVVNSGSLRIRREGSW